MFDGKFFPPPPADPPATNTAKQAEMTVYTPEQLAKFLFLPEDEMQFEDEYRMWLTRGAFQHIFDEDWERWLRQKKETPSPRCRHGKNPMHCNVCYFED